MMQEHQAGAVDLAGEEGIEADEEEAEEEAEVARVDVEDVVEDVVSLCSKLTRKPMFDNPFNL